MDRISLKGGNIYYTPTSDAAYTVEKGPILVYLVPITDGIPGRRLLLCEANEGERIPGLYSDTELLGRWQLGIMALEKAELSVHPEADSRLVTQFARRIGLHIFDPEEFAEELIERYNLSTFREEVLITATAQEQAESKERSLRLILNMFPKRDKGENFVPPSGNNLYDAAAWLCRKEKITIASFDRVKDCCGRRFTVEDIARVSHFIIREVVLEEKWYQKDCGALLVFKEGDNSPFACSPRNPYSYNIYDPKTGNSVKLDKKTANGLSLKAYMFYRPFPEKPIKPKDLFLFSLQKVYPSDLLRLFTFALLGTLVGLLLPMINEQAYDKFIPMGNASALAQLGVVLLACSVGNITFTIVKNLATFRSMKSMEYAAQSAAFDRVFNLPQSFFREFDAANLGSRLLNISSIFNLLATSIISSLISAVFSLMYLWRMFAYSKSLSATAIIFIVILMALILVLGFRQIRFEKQKLDVDYDANSDIFQFLSGISKIRIAGAEDRAMYRYMEKAVQSQQIQTKKERITAIVGTVQGSAQLFFTLVFYYIMIHKNLSLSIGAFSGFMAAFGSFSASMLEICQNFLNVNMVKPMLDDAKPFLETMPESSTDAALPGDIKGEIELNNVTFSYVPGEAPVLRDLNLHIKPGEYVGIVGGSGGGKSTLLKLLLGFEKPQIGCVYYDNRDIDELDKRELRKKFGVVLQDGGIIAGSIYENITITTPNCKMARVEEVVREVGLEDDIKNMPMGLHTVLSDGGGAISGGQAQRILIARALVGKPKVIFLDEATSALDNVTQNQVVQTLEKIKATKIVVAHRLSTVQRCDRIIVMSAGRIAEEGTYQELMDKKGLFYELAIRQIS